MPFNPHNLYPKKSTVSTLTTVKHNMVNLILGLSIATIPIGFASANDSTGYIGTGGVTYVKNNDISMQSEDLFISKYLIKVDYEFVNLSNHDITETVLFPLPALDTPIDGDFAEPDTLLDTFKIYADNAQVEPELNIRTYMPVNILLEGVVDFNEASERKMIDTTQLFKECGVSEQEMLGFWGGQNNRVTVNNKLMDCDHIALKALQKRQTQSPDGYIEDTVYWESEPVYSWEQTFKANSTTYIRHTYQPLVGGSVYFDDAKESDFCAGDTIKKALGKGLHSYSALEYILTTGANWATPINKFTLTVERDPDEWVTFCWKGKGVTKKVGRTTFQVVETDFIPTHDLNIAFISR